MSHERRRRPVAIMVEKSGKQVKTIGCPFCRPSHELRADGQPSPCGTYLLIEAVQDIHFEKNIICIVCGKTGGTMVKVGDKYKHMNDCDPRKKMFSKPPKLSKLAGYAWKLPPAVQKFTGILPVEVYDDKGKILGYTFDKP